MKALVFTFQAARLAAAKLMGLFGPRGYLLPLGPLSLADVPEPEVLGDNWVVVQTRYGGICGSDLKQVFLDGAVDNPLTSLMSFPHVMGHEVTGTVVDVGAAVTHVAKGDRVICYPWLSCVVRGLPPCEACRAGRLNLCTGFTAGAFAEGMHYGACRDVSGGFAPLLPAHESMCFPVPDGVTFEQAVMADPVAVALGALLKAPPRPGETALVLGCGPLGLLLVHLIARLYPGVEVLAVDRHPHLDAVARELGGHDYLMADGGALIEEIATRQKARIHRPLSGLPWLMDGVDRVYDVVGSGGTLATSLRLVKPRGTVVLVGVSRPERFEWTPLFFKEVTLIGSSGCGREEFEGRAVHGFQLFLELVASGRIDPARLLTHTFPLAGYRDAFVTAADKGRHRAVKVVFDLEA